MKFLPEMSKSRLSQLTAAMNERYLVRIFRRFENFPIRGYVLSVGPHFFLLAVVSDRVWFDGFESSRISDIQSVQADPYSVFVEMALKKRGQRRPKKPKIDVESTEDILLTASKTFPLVTIHLEKKNPDVCHIGRVNEVTKGRVSLIEITPYATWESQPNVFRLSDITRIDFGGDYENALHSVVGDARG